MRAVSSLAVALAAAFAVAAPGPGLAATAHFTSAWFLGDSLSDPGNLHEATGGAIPESPPYYEGRRSNGPVWAEHVARDFEERGLATGNVAHAFANAVTNDDLPSGLPLQVPDLPEQVGRWQAQSAGRLGARPLASLWFGANDIFTTIAGSAGLSGAEAAARVAGAAQAAAVSVDEGVRGMHALGVKDFVVFNLPALDQTPAFMLFQPEAQSLAKVGTDVFNAALAAGLDGLGDAARVQTIDTDGLFAALMADPQDFGLASATVPCIIPGVSVCSPGEADLLAFFDGVHPNQVVHALLADVVREHAAPVPVPLPGLMLVGGVVLLAGMRRRARG